MEGPREVTSEDLHGTYLDRSRRELQKNIEQLQRALTQENEKLATIAESQQGRGSSNGISAIGTKQQLDAVAEAYRDVAASEPLLPFPDSVVPALIALRTTKSITNETNEILASQTVSLDEAQGRLDAETASLADQKALTVALENRIQSLRDGIDTNNAMTPAQVARGKMSELQEQINDTDADTSKLRETLKTFIDGSLSAMLAAEEIGGPVAGDMMDVDSDTLEAGFTTTGKRKKLKADASSDKKQRRIDDMFGGRGGAEDDSESQAEKRTAAREDMQELVTELIHKLMAAGGSSSDAYINISKESASVRFLTRVKVAEFHPRNSNRLRLVDFGRAIGE